MSTDWGIATFKRGKWRVQVYWPYVRLRTTEAPRNYREVILSADSVFRACAEDGYIGMGLQLIGFGLAFDYFDKPIDT